MQSISSRAFQQIFRFGVDLSARPPQSPELPDSLDQNGDNRLSGRELSAAFAAVDSYDRDGSRHSFQLAGQAGKLFSALLTARRSGPYRGAAIAAAARDRCERLGLDYAVKSAPTSPHPRLTQNHHPGQSRLTYLQGQWKCNQFVGDALTQAGLAMPTYRMPDGSEHYMTAEDLPRQERYFDRLCRLEEVQPGDVLVVDWPPRGAATAHTEVLTQVSWQQPGGVSTAGAHREGAWESSSWEHLGDWREALQQATFNPQERCWQQEGYRIYLLRPLKAER